MNPTPTQRRGFSNYRNRLRGRYGSLTSRTKKFSQNHQREPVFTEKRTTITFVIKIEGVETKTEISLEKLTYGRINEIWEWIEESNEAKLLCQWNDE